MREPSPTDVIGPTSGAPKNYYRNRLIVVAAIIGSISLLAACGEGYDHKEFVQNYAEQYGTPDGATNIEVVGDNFYTFEWRDQCFLGHRAVRRAAVTRIDCDE